jgi:hypothetical protein
MLGFKYLEYLIFPNIIHVLCARVKKKKQEKENPRWPLRRCSMNPEIRASKSQHLKEFACAKITPSGIMATFFCLEITAGNALWFSKVAWIKSEAYFPR